MKTYRSLIVSIYKDMRNHKHYMFPYSSDDKAKAAFDSWVGKAKEVLGERMTDYHDLSDEFGKEANFRVDGEVYVAVCEEETYWDDDTLLDKEPEIEL